MYYQENSTLLVFQTNQNMANPEWKQEKSNYIWAIPDVDTLLQSDWGSRQTTEVKVFSAHKICTAYLLPDTLLKTYLFSHMAGVYPFEHIVNMQIQKGFTLIKQS